MNTVKSNGKGLFMLVGAPGAGKHTLIKQGFNGHVNYGYVEMGQIMRDEVKQGTSIGARIHEFQSEGRLVPDEITLGIAQREFNENSLHSVLFLDGFPRTISQVDLALEMARSHGFCRFVIINIDTSDATCVERICAARRGRGDDGDAELAKARLEVFRQETVPIIAYLKAHLTHIEADFISISGERMKEEAARRAYGLCLTYDIPIIQPFLV